MKILKNKFLLQIIFSLFFFCGLIFSQSKKIFVGTNGDDLNSGLSTDQQLKTINAAIGKTGPGDTVCVLPGTYSEIINFDLKNGEPENPICIKGLSENGNDFPVIDGGAAVPAMELTNYWIRINNSSWIEIENLKFVNGWTYPIDLENSSYITFRGCKFFGARRVISVNGKSSHHILVENCFWDQGGEFLWKVEEDKQGVDAWTSMHHGNMMYFNGSIIDFSGTGGSIIVRNNKIINAFNAVRWRGENGCDANVEIYGNDISQIRDNDFEPEIYTYNLHVYHNKSHNVHRTMSVDNVRGGNVYYYGNIATTDSDDWTKKVCTGFWKIYGNEANRTFPMYAFNNSFYGVARAMRAEQKVVLFKHYNNAYFFTGDTAWYLDKWDESNEFDYDISNRNWPDVFIMNAQEKHGSIANVDFVDAQNGNLKLRPLSPGIDAGRIMSFPEFSWTQQFEGKAPDVGAYENSNLVDGPPFRFMIPPGSKIDYKEKPRIVRYYATENKLTLFFSDKLDTTLNMSGSIKVFVNNNEIEISSVSYKDAYSLLIETTGELTTQNLAVKFIFFPKSINGQAATTWASAIKIIK